MKSEAQNNTVSAEEIRKYLSGELSSTEAHRLEKIALDDPFLADALEGFSEPAAMEYFSKKSRFQDRSYGAKLGLWTSLVIAILFAALGVWCFYFAKQNTTEQAQINTSNIEQNGATTPQENIEVLTTTSSDSTISFITKQVAEEKKPSDDAFVLVENIKASKNDASDAQNQRDLDAEKMKKIELETVLQSLEKYKDDRAEKLRVNVERSAGNDIYHVRTYKVADYRALRGEYITLSELQQSTGLDAAYENANHEVLHHDDDLSLDIQYANYLDMAIAQFASKNYRKAAHMFAIILEQFPGDANGRFYRAMSLYEMGDYLAAVDQFNSAEKDGVSVFRRESDFYLALSLKQIGRTKEACELFNKIGFEGAFYAEKARAEAKKLNCN
ncbi:MAG: tetratricopeptide repeat protein [Flavobacteriales bacterium]|nr:tetratricopeptide repeat protein [Flavobacteriales bacterium]